VNHVVIGAAIPLFVCALVYAAHGFRAGWKLLVFGPIAMLLSGIVAVAPDLPRPLGDLERYQAWHKASWCNLSWGHCWIDARKSVDEWRGWPVVAIAYGALVLLVAYRELRRLERGP
jgi:hypothetical protein